MLGSAQPGFWSRSGDGFQRDMLLKKQCLCLGSRAKCCLFPDAFLEHRGGSAAARHSWNGWDRMEATLRGNDQVHLGLGTWWNFLSLSKKNLVSFFIDLHLLQISTILVCVNDTVCFSFTWSSKLYSFWSLHINVFLSLLSHPHTVPSDWDKYSQVAQTTGCGEKKKNCFG